VHRGASRCSASSTLGCGRETGRRSALLHLPSARLGEGGGARHEVECARGRLRWRGGAAGARKAGGERHGREAAVGGERGRVEPGGAEQRLARVRRAHQPKLRRRGEARLALRQQLEHAVGHLDLRLE